MDTERKEALIRIPIALISWIIMEVWGLLVIVLTIFHWFVVIFTAKRNKAIASFGNQYASYLHNVVRYLTFATDERPFPFNNDMKTVEKLDMKKSKK